MLSASWCIVRRNGHHDDGKVLLLRCFLLLSCHHVLHSRIRRCLQRPAPHVEAVVQARKKKVLVHGLLQRVHPRLVGSSRKKRKLDQSSPQQSRRKCVWTYLKLLPSFVRISTRTHFTHREFPFLFYRHHPSKKRNPDRHDHMATSTTLGARLSARRGGATPRPASRQPWRRRAATVSHSALGSGIRGTRRQRSVRGQSEVSAGRGFGGGTVTTKELCCPCGQHGLPYKKCCKPYHQASRVADTPRKLLETRFSAYEKGLSQYIVETELATDKDKNSEGRRQDIEASTEKLKFSNLKVSLLLLAVVLAPDLALLLAGAGGGRARRHSCRDTLPLLCAGRGAEGVPRGKARADRGDEPLCQEGWLVALQRRHDRPETKLSSRAAGGRDERETREEAK